MVVWLVLVSVTVGAQRPDTVKLRSDVPLTYVVKKGDTLWDISQIFLKSPWRWPELWGMNRDQIRNPHLIYPGQVLLLVKSGGRARLELAQGVGGGAGGAVKLSPRMRITSLDANPIASIPLNLIQPFLTEAVVFDTDKLATAPRIVATEEGHVVLGQGGKAYARGDFNNAVDFRIFRTARELRDPTTKEILGYEAPYVGTAELTRAADTRPGPDGKPESIPATIKVNLARLEVGVGDRLAPAPARDPLASAASSRRTHWCSANVGEPPRSPRSPPPPPSTSTTRAHAERVTRAAARRRPGVPLASTSRPGVGAKVSTSSQISVTHAE